MKIFALLELCTQPDDAKRINSIKATNKITRISKKTTISKNYLGN